MSKLSDAIEALKKLRELRIAWEAGKTDFMSDGLHDAEWEFSEKAAKFFGPFLDGVR